MLIGLCGLAGSGKDTCADFLVRDHGFTKVAFADPMKRICRDVYDFSYEQLWGPSEMRNAPDIRYPRKHTFKHVAEARNLKELDACECSCCGARIKDGASPHGALPNCYLTPRFALQQLGSEWGRHCFSETWPNYALRVAKLLSVEGGYTYDQIHGLEHTWRPGDDNWKTPVVISDVRFKNEIEAIKMCGGKVIRIVRPGAGLSGAAAAHGSETEQAAIPDAAFDAVVRNDETLKKLRAAMYELREL